MPSHACQRALERYGLVLTTTDLKLICRIVQRNEATLDRINDNKTTQWFLEYGGVRVRVVISADFYTVCSFIPLVDGWRGKQRSRKKRQRKVKIWRDGRAEWVKGYPV